MLVVTLIAAVGFAPIASSWHELTVRHVICAEHGELTDVQMHVQITSGAAAEAARGVVSVRSEDVGAADGHEHCANGFLVRGRLHVSVIRSQVRYTPPPAVAREVRETAVSPGRAFVLASAPKTSPPSV